MSDSVFDDTASAFADSIDRAIATNTYFRGELFVATARREVPPGARVLDYGCGPGRMARLIAEQGYAVDAVDPSPMMILEAKKQTTDGLRIAFRVNGGNGEDLETDAYASIVCSSVVEFVPDVGGLLRNLSRALRPEGVLILSYSNKYSLWRAYATLRYRRSLRHLTVQHNVWSLRQTRAALNQAGLEVTSGPVFFEGAPFEKRPRLRFLTAHPLIGILGLITARRRAAREVR